MDFLKTAHITQVEQLLIGVIYLFLPYHVTIHKSQHLRTTYVAPSMMKTKYPMTDSICRLWECCYFYAIISRQCGAQRAKINLSHLRAPGGGSETEMITTGPGAFILVTAVWILIDGHIGTALVGIATPSVGRAAGDAV